MIKMPSYQNQPAVVNFIFLIAILAISYGSVWLLIDHHFLAFLVILAVGLFALGYLRSWKLLAIYLFVAIFGTVMEALFIAWGFWSYEKYSFLSVPLYLPLIWGNIAILSIGIFKGALMVYGNHMIHQPPTFIRSIVATLLATITLIASVYIFHHRPLGLILGILTIDVLYVCYMRSAPLVIVGLFALFCGTIGDLVSVWLGVWNYTTAFKIAGVPAYVFIGWDLVGILITGLYVSLDSPDAPLPKWMKK